jgi:replicative DNA helicase
MTATQVTPGRVPPHSVEAEEQLLAACLLDGQDVIGRCIEAKIAPASFYVPANRVIFGKLLDLYGAGKSTELHVLAEELKAEATLSELGGYAYLVRISGRIPTTAGAAYFIEKVRELALLREIIRACTGGVEDAYDYTGGIQEFADKIERDIFAVTQQRVGDSAKLVRDPMKDAMAAFRLMAAKKAPVEGVLTGLADIDRILGGLKPAEMIVLAGRPSCGKTALAMNIAEAAAMPRHGPGKAALVFSLEMSSPELCKRLLCSRARVNARLLRQGMVNKSDMAELDTAEAEFSRSALYIDDASSPTVMEIRAKARRVHMRSPLSLIVVDYLQLVAPGDRRAQREQQVAEASRNLKALAKELALPVLVLAQLNREAEKSDRRPRLSDLRESGAIEQDADVVMMLSRPKEEGASFQVAAGAMDLTIAKNRNGEVGDVRLTFQNSITRFENYTQ